MESPQDYDNGNYRATGRTIRRKLEVVLNLSSNPNEWVRVQDHWNHPEATRHLVKWVKDFCSVHGMDLREKKILSERESQVFLMFVPRKSEK